MVTPNLPEARALSGLGEDGPAAELAAAVRALGPAAALVTGGHGEGSTCSTTGPASPLMIPGPLHPDGAAHGSGCTHSSALAALLARGLTLPRRRRRAREIAAGAVARGLRDIGAGAAPSTYSDCARCAAGDSARPACARCHNHRVKLVRMRSGHGDQLLVEGDPEVDVEEQALIHAFRRQLAEGLWAAVPTGCRPGRREAMLVREFSEVPRDAERVIFFPRRPADELLAADGAVRRPPAGRTDRLPGRGSPTARSARAAADGGVRRPAPASTLDPHQIAAERQAEQLLEAAVGSGGARVLPRARLSLRVRRSRG